MTFINPYLLFGLFAVAIPILLHLFNLQKVRKMEFSTLMFLKEIQKSKLRRIRIKQILLLILRICIIVFIVLAFSNPVYKGYLAGNNPDIRKCGIFLLDNSFSMSIKDDKGSSYEQAKNSLKNILSLYNSGDKLFLITSSHLKSFEKDELKDAQSLLDSVSKLELTSVRFDASGLMKYVKEIIGKNNFPLYEVFILSDNQKTNYKSESKSEKLFEDNGKNIRFYNIDIGKRTANNISIEKAEVKSRIPELNKEIKISVAVKNHNNFNCLNKQINLFIDDKKAAETVIDIASGERKDVSLSFRPLRKGSISGYVELLQPDFFEDEILQDNKYFFSLYIPEKINAGLIGDNEIAFRYVKLAVESAEKLSGTGNKTYYLNSYGNINEQVRSSDMLIISGKNNFSESESEILSEYIKNGGGVILFPGKNMNTESINSFLSRINSFRLGNISRITPDTSLENKFDRIDFEHPLFYGAFRNEELSVTSEKFFVESPGINFLYEIVPGSNTKSLMTLPGGNIFLAESDYGEGRLILCAVSADEEMSDFPKKSLFPLIISRSIHYLGNGVYKNDNNIAGRNNIVTLGKNKLFSVPYSEKFSEQGIYGVFDSSLNQNLFFALNRDTLESALRKSDVKEIKDFFGKYKINSLEYISDAAEVNSVVVKAREGKELWKYFAVLALIFIILEMAYAKKLEKI
ncbi:MAG: BatA domain-containing protein [Ignavibacteriae bacterium]|nr:BatA domain-containing protein [Ignavibacteriota bacterium]